MDRIAKNIKLVREFRNLTQENIAQSVGVSQATYCRIETGKTDIRVSMLRAIAKALGMPFQKIVSDDPVEVLRAMQEQQNTHSPSHPQNQPMQAA